MVPTSIEFVWAGKSTSVSEELVERIRSKLFEGKGTFSRYTIVDDSGTIPETLHLGGVYRLVVSIC